jgi:hypothetical protein
LISKAGTDEQKTSQILKTEFKPFWQVVQESQKLVGLCMKHKAN